MAKAKEVEAKEEVKIEKAAKKKYIAESHLVHGSEFISIGSEVEFTEEEAKRLLEMGAISEADE